MAELLPDFATIDASIRVHERRLRYFMQGYAIMLGGVLLIWSGWFWTTPGPENSWHVIVYRLLAAAGAYFLPMALFPVLWSRLASYPRCPYCDGVLRPNRWLIMNSWSDHWLAVTGRCPHCGHRAVTLPENPQPGTLPDWAEWSQQQRPRDFQENWRYTLCQMGGVLLGIFSIPLTILLISPVKPTPSMEELSRCFLLGAGFLILIYSGLIPSISPHLPRRFRAWYSPERLPCPQCGNDPPPGLVRLCGRCDQCGFRLISDPPEENLATPKWEWTQLYHQRYQEFIFALGILAAWLLVWQLIEFCRRTWSWSNDMSLLLIFGGFLPLLGLNVLIQQRLRRKHGRALRCPGCNKRINTDRQLLQSGRCAHCRRLIVRFPDDPDSGRIDA